jgi:heterodisulfide reductase subunit B
LRYEGTTRVRHPLEVLVDDIGLDAIAQRVKHPLDGLKVAPYYGCQIVRPYALFDSQQNPRTMDRLLEVTGAKVIEYPLKTRCCGGSQTGTLPKIGLELVYTILKEAQDRDADIVATVCPLCQFNLDMYQDHASRRREPVSIPVVYFTQLLGLALGVPSTELGLRRSVVPAEPVLAGRTANV